MQLKRVSIIIPVFNERTTVRTLIDRVKAAPTPGLEKEIIIVDDGSTDGTTQLLHQLPESTIKTTFLPTNQGKGTAVRHGINHATGDIILIQDADLEYDPHDYVHLLTPFRDTKVTVVYGSRELKKENAHASFSFWLGGRFITYVTNVLYGSQLTDVPTCYKAFRRDLLITLPLVCQRFEFCPEVTAHLLRRKVPILEVPIAYSPRTKKQGKKIGSRDGLEAISTLIRVRLSR